MGYWGWRPLVFGIFISAWVVGCNVIPDTASPSLAPSNYPDVTLTVGRLPTSRVGAAPTRALSIPVSTDEPAGTIVPMTASRKLTSSAPATLWRRSRRSSA